MERIWNKLHQGEFYTDFPCFLLLTAWKRVPCFENLPRLSLRTTYPPICFACATAVLRTTVIAPDLPAGGAPSSSMAPTYRCQYLSRLTPFFQYPDQKSSYISLVITCLAKYLSRCGGVTRFPFFRLGIVKYHVFHWPREIYFLFISQKEVTPFFSNSNPVWISPDMSQEIAEAFKTHNAIRVKMPSMRGSLHDQVFVDYRIYLNLRH